MSSNIKTGNPSAEPVATSSTSTGTLETGRDTDGALDIPIKESSNTIKISEPLDEKNWPVWKERMKLVLHLCGLEGYVDRTIQCP